MNTLSAFLAAESAPGSALEHTLKEWLPRRRWFRAKAKTLASVVVENHFPLGAEDDAPRFCVLKTTFTDGTLERYALPLCWLLPDEAAGLPEAAVVGPLGSADGKILGDASWNAAFREALFDVVKENETEGPGDFPVSRVLGVEQSNTSFAYEGPGGGRFVKLYRRLEEAVNPEPEILRFLRDHTDYRHVPRFESSLDLNTGNDAHLTLALMQDLVPARGDAWEYALENLRAPGAPGPEFSAWVSLLGRRVGELHAALASAPHLPDFAPEPLTAADLDRVQSGTRALLTDALSALETWTRAPRKPDGNGAALKAARGIVEGRARLEALLQAAPVGFARGALKTRTHGDLHLGQILVGARDPGTVWILDFEGEPGRPLAEARRKQSPLRDVAGMLRSFHYAAHAAERAAAPAGEPGRPGGADVVAKALGKAFWEGYARAPGLDVNPEGYPRLLDLFILEKAVYELHYELNNRPDWVEIPVRGLLSLLEDAVHKP